MISLTTTGKIVMQLDFEKFSRSMYQNNSNFFQPLNFLIYHGKDSHAIVVINCSKLLNMVACVLINSRSEHS